MNIGNDISEGEGKEMEKHNFSGVHRVTPTYTCQIQKTQTFTTKSSNKKEVQQQKVGVVR